MLELEGRRSALHILCVSVVSVLSLMINAAEMEGYDKKNAREFCGIANIKNSIFNYNEYISEAETYTKWCLQEKQLPDTIIHIIGTSSVDVYPFEFSYIAQNNLNWQPRAALGTALSPWLETQSARNFAANDDAVRFILWHFQDDMFGKKSVSIDNRYFLNDEPQIVREIFANYEVVAVSDNLLLFSHIDTPELAPPTVGEPFDVRWNEWVDIPKTDSSIVRVKVVSEPTLIGKIRSFIYKERTFTIEYQTDDGNIYPYRYIPSSAEEGLWCAPFVLMPCENSTEPTAVRFRLSTDDDKWVKPDVTLQFEYINILGNIKL